MNRPKFYLVIGFARRCICNSCERFIDTNGKKGKPCAKSVRNAAELQRMQEESAELSAQPADRELDPEADPPPPIPHSADPFDERDAVEGFLMDQRRAKEDRIIAARAAAGARLAALHRQRRLAALQQRQPE